MSDRASLVIALFASASCAPALVRELRSVGTLKRVNHSGELISAISEGARMLVIDVGNWVALTISARESIERQRLTGRFKVVLVMEKPERPLSGELGAVDLRLRASSSAASFASALHEFLVATGILNEPSSPNHAALPRPAITAPKVLIVDDSSLNNRITSVILNDAGYSVFCVTNPFDMRRTVQVQAPDLVLVEYNMPALRGDHLIEINQRTGVNVPMLLYSNASDDILAVAAHRCGAAGYIRKSASPMLLLSRIAACINQSSGLASGQASSQASSQSGGQSQSGEHRAASASSGSNSAVGKAVGGRRLNPASTST